MESTTETTETPEVQPEEAKQEVSPPDPSAPAWEGGPTGAQIENWKNQYGEVWVTAITESERYAWRTLNRFEWKRLQETLEQLVQNSSNTQAQLAYEELVCEACVLHPQVNKVELQQKKAGVASLIAQQILDASGFVSIDIERL